MTEKERAVGYLRVSTTEQADRYGLPVQERDVREYARRHGFRLVAIMRDKGVSGTVPVDQRDGFVEALNMIRQGEAEVLIMARLDRLARNLTIQEGALAHVWKAEGRVHTADAGEFPKDDPDDPMRTAMRQMMGVFSQLDRAMIARRMRDGKAAKRGEGGYAGGQPRYGSRAGLVERNGVKRRELVKRPEEKEAVKRAAGLRRRGKSLREICAILGTEGFRPRKAARWHPTVVSRILRREGVE